MQPPPPTHHHQGNSYFLSVFLQREDGFLRCRTAFNFPGGGMVVFPSAKLKDRKHIRDEPFIMVWGGYWAKARKKGRKKTESEMPIGWEEYYPGYGNLRQFRYLRNLWQFRYLRNLWQFRHVRFLRKLRHFTLIIEKIVKIESAGNVEDIIEIVKIEIAGNVGRYQKNRNYLKFPDPGYVYHIWLGKKASASLVRKKNKFKISAQTDRKQFFMSRRVLP